MRSDARRAIREALRRVLHGSLPREVGVDVREVRPGLRRRDVLYVRAELVVHKDSLKGTVIGRGGRTIKRIGIEARKLLERRWRRRVFLDLTVVVDPERAPVNRWFRVECGEDVFECPAFKHPQHVRARGVRIRGNARVAAFTEVVDSTIHGGVMISNFSRVVRSTLHKRVSVSSHCAVQDSELGPLTFVGDGARIEGSEIGERCFVGMGASVRDARVGRWSVVGAGSRVEGDVPERSLVIGERVVDRLDFYELVLKEGGSARLEVNGRLRERARVSEGGELRVCYLPEENELVLSRREVGRVLCVVRRDGNGWRIKGRGYEREGTSVHWYVGEEWGLLT